MNRLWFGFLFGLILGIQAAQAVGPGNIALNSDIDVRTRRAASDLLDAMTAINRALAKIENRQIGASLSYMSVAMSLLSESSSGFSAIIEKYPEELMKAKFRMPESAEKRAILQQWADKIGRKSFKSGYDILFQYWRYIDETNSWIEKNREIAKASATEVRRFVFEFGDRLRFLYQIGSIISEGYALR